MRGRVGRVVQAKGRRGLGYRQVAYPRLNPCSARARVDMEDFVKARHHQQQTFFQRQGTAGQPRAGPPCDHRYAHLMADAQQLLHLVEVTGQRHQQGRGAIGRQPVALVGRELFTLMQDFKLRQARLQGVQQGGFINVRQYAVDAFIVEDIHGGSRHSIIFI